MADILFISLSLGSILLLIGLGLAITYGAMGVINMAHGQLVMIGAYSTVIGIKHLGLHFLLCIPFAFVVAALLGLLIERIVVRRLYGRLLDTLLATWGVGIILQQLVRVEFGAAFFGRHIDGLGAGLQNVPIPPILRDTFLIGDFVVQPYRSFIILLTAGLVILTWWLIYRTSFGTQLRAVSRNRAMAASCGIDDKRINAWTFAYGSGLAGVAGVMLSGFKTVSPNLGQVEVVDGFMVVVVGGVGSLLGTVAASGLLGGLNGFVAFWSNDIIGRAAVFGVVILIILLRPQGLFAFKGR